MPVTQLRPYTCNMKFTEITELTVKTVTQLGVHKSNTNQSIEVTQLRVY
jgi:hypothetical protein